jgi:hypothetical protein
VDVAVEAGPITLTDGEGSFAVSNLTDKLIVIVSALDADGCSFLDPPAVPLPAGERTDVTLSTECDVPDPGSLTLTFAMPSGGAVNPPSASVNVKAGGRARSGTGSAGVTEPLARLPPLV